MTPSVKCVNSNDELLFGCLNVCGLKRRLYYPEFQETFAKFDLFCVTESKLDDTDVISLPGHCFLSQIRKQKFIRRSGGIAVFYKEKFEDKIKILSTESDYILWLRIDHSILDIPEDLLLGILYIPPTQSRFLNEDEYLSLENEITLMCSKSSYICLAGDMNARTAQLCDFITADRTISDIMQFDQETLEFFNISEMLDKLNINKQRASQDNLSNTNGNKLIDMCINNNLFILNGRCGKDKNIGRCTFRGKSLIDYTICSTNCLKLLVDFEVEDTDALLSDGHSLLKWSFGVKFDNDANDVPQTPHKLHKNWDNRRIDNFKSNISIERVNEICTNLKPTRACIDDAVTEVANVFATAAKMSFPVVSNKTKSSSHKAWFGPKCNQARTTYRKAKNKYKRFRNEYNATKLQESSKQYKKVMNFL